MDDQEQAQIIIARFLTVTVEQITITGLQLVQFSRHSLTSRDNSRHDTTYQIECTVVSRGKARSRVFFVGWDSLDPDRFNWIYTRREWSLFDAAHTAKKVRKPGKDHPLTTPDATL